MDILAQLGYSSNIINHAKDYFKDIYNIYKINNRSLVVETSTSSNTNLDLDLESTISDDEIYITNSNINNIEIENEIEIYLT